MLCNELFEHVQDLQLAFREIARVLRPGRRLVATCPLAFGQRDSIVKAVHNPATGEAKVSGEPDYHGDPVRPEQDLVTAIDLALTGERLFRQLKQSAPDQPDWVEIYHE